jgi:hypothetical protein
MSETDTVLLELRDLGIQQLPAPGDAPDLRLFRAMEREMARDHRRFVLTGRGSATDHRSGSRLASPRIKRSRRFALAGSIAVAGLAVAGVLGFQDSGFTPPPALAATMDRLGDIAVTQDWGGIPGPGQYLYTESESVQITNGVASPVDHRQIWVPSVGHVLLSDPEANPNDIVDQIDGPSGAFPTTIEGWKSLSSNPSTLLQQIHELDAPGATDTPAEQFADVGDALRETTIPPATRAILYQAVALIPGVELMGPQTNPTGQTGLGVGYYVNGTLLNELIFDQQNGSLIGELDYDQAGNLTYAISYIEQKIVDTAPSVGSTPAPTQYPQFNAVTPQGEAATLSASTTPTGQPTSPTTQSTAATGDATTS